MKNLLKFIRRTLSNEHGYWAMAVFSVLRGLSEFASARQNAAYARADAKQAKITAAAEAARERRQNIARLSAIQAETGAQGTTMEGSPMEVYLQSVQQGALNVEDKLYAGRLKARSLKEQAGIYENQGWSSLLGGLGSAAGALTKK